MRNGNERKLNMHRNTCNHRVCRCHLPRMFISHKLTHCSKCKCSLSKFRHSNKCRFSHNNTLFQFSMFSMYKCLIIYRHLYRSHNLNKIRNLRQKRLQVSKFRQCLMILKDSMIEQMISSWIKSRCLKRKNKENNITSHETLAETSVLIEHYKTLT